MTTLVVAGHTVSDGAALLDLRAGLPGASGYDRSAQALRVAAAHGLGLRDRLPLALHGSWMVNSRATSPVFQRWLQPAAEPAWEVLDAALAGGWDPSSPSRETAGQAAAWLCSAGTGVAALSKALGLLYPQGMLLMDDHALAYLGVAPAPAPGEEQGTAGADCFVPALDAFTAAVEDNFDALVTLARGHRAATLAAAQVLDRVLWMDSYGRRFFAASP